jgi:hypothetical protein
MIDQKQIVKQMIDFNRAAFNNTFNAMSMLQDQSERVAATLLEQATWLPEEGKKAVSDWAASFKTGRDQFKKYADESYAKVEDFFTNWQK